jgi:plastocyanin
MKRLLLAVACTVTLAAGDLSAAPVTGKVAFLTKRGQHPVPAETLVWLEPIGWKAPKKPAASFELATRNKSLLPHVLAVPAGSSVSFPNEDPITHNIFSLSSGNMFDLGFYRKGPGKTQKFDQPGVVNVYCNVHPNMSAVIHVMPTPFYAFADNNGTFTVDAPAGKYRLVAWNEQGGQTESTVEIGTRGDVTGGVALTIDSRSFRAGQHMNKLGKPYQAPKDY